MKKSYCKNCECRKPNKKVLETKETVNEWLILLFTLPCKKCNITTWRQLEAMRPNSKGGKDLVMITTNIDKVDILNEFKGIL